MTAIYPPKSPSEASSDKCFELTPTERQAAMIADLEARLQLQDERIFFLVAQVRHLEALHGLGPCSSFPGIQNSPTP